MDVERSDWRQGSVLPSELVQVLISSGELPARAQAPSIVIVVSHDCDAASTNLESEPFIEVIIGKHLPLDAKDATFFYGGARRRFQFLRSEKDVEELYELAVDDRLRCKRATFLKRKPASDRAIDRKVVRDIALWLAKRYYRAAFPDAFVERLKHWKSKVKKILKDHGEIDAVYFFLGSQGELPPEVTYKIVLWIAMRDLDYQNPQARRKVEKIADSLAAELSNCGGIELGNHEVRSNAHITLEDWSELLRWDFDAMSLKESAA